MLDFMRDLNTLMLGLFWIALIIVVMVLGIIEIVDNAVERYAKKNQTDENEEDIY